MNDIVKKIRSNNSACWAVALIIGVIFRYIYGFFKRLISSWGQNFDFSTSSALNDHPFAFLIAFNIGIDFFTSLIASAICGAILVFTFERKALSMCAISLIAFLSLSSRLWKFWKYPELSMQISSLMGPVVAGVVFLTTVWLLVKIEKHDITLGSTSRR